MNNSSLNTMSARYTGSLLIAAGLVFNPSFIAAFHYVEVETVFLKIIDLTERNDIRLLVTLFPSKEFAYKSEYLKLIPGDYLDNEEEDYARLYKIAKEREIDCVDLTEKHPNQNVPHYRYSCLHDDTDMANYHVETTGESDQSVPTAASHATSVF